MEGISEVLRGITNYFTALQKNQKVESSALPGWYIKGQKKHCIFKASQTFNHTSITEAEVKSDSMTHCLSVTWLLQKSENVFVVAQGVHLSDEE